MTYVRWALIAIIVLGVGGLLHYSLPSRDIVRIVGTDVVRSDVTEVDANGNEVTRTRDVQRINAITESGQPSVYRNEDTGWGFPFYFKFDTADLAAEAHNAISTEANPQWMVVRHYGWRFTMASMFPNALSMRPADGPDESLFPWFNAVFIGTFVIVLLTIYRVLVIVRRRHVDPMIDAIDTELDETASWWRKQWRKIAGR